VPKVIRTPSGRRGRPGPARSRLIDFAEDDPKGRERGRLRLAPRRLNRPRLSLSRPSIVAVCAALLYVAAAACFPWDKPGLQYDEALFVRDAVPILGGKAEVPFGHEPLSWIQIGRRSLPIMDLPYAGATKGYLAVVPFALFGSSAAVCRALAVFMTALGIGGIIWAIGRELSPGVAAAVGAVIALHPAMLDQTVYDNSAVALWMATLGLAAATMSWLMRTASDVAALAFGAALGFALWGRLNFLWLIAAAAIAAAIFAPLLRWLKDGAVSLALGFAVGSAPLLLYEALTSAGTLKFIRNANTPGGALGQLPYRIHLLGEVLLSDEEHRAIWGGPGMPTWQIVFASALAAAGIGAALFALKSGSESARDVAWRRATALTVLLFIAQMLASRLIIAQHHLVTAVPLAAFAAALGYRRIAATPARRIVLGLAVGLFAALGLSWNWRSAAGIRRTGGHGVWSDAIDEVVGTVGAQAPGSTTRVLTWGLSNSIYVLTRGASAPQEEYWGASEETSAWHRGWNDEIRKGGWFLIGAEPSPAKAGLQRALEAARPPTRRWTFRERDGTFYAELIHVLPAETRSSEASGGEPTRP